MTLLFHRNSFLRGRAVEGTKEIHSHGTQRSRDGKGNVGAKDTRGENIA